LSENIYASTHSLEPEEPALVEEPNVRSQSLGVHQENLITNSWKVVSTDTTIGNHSLICETRIYCSHDNLPQSTKSADIKRIGASIITNMQGKFS